MLEEKKTIPAIQVFQHRELAQKIAGLTEDIEELKSEKVLLLNQLSCADDYSIAEVKQRITSIENSLNKLDQQAADMDILDTCHAIRLDKEHETAQRLQAAYGKKFNSGMLAQSRKDIAKILDEPAESLSIRQQIKSQSIHLQKHRLHQINRPDR